MGPVRCMADKPYEFPVELRRRRRAAGLSLADLAARVHYSKSHLSKVETGHRHPAADLARLCDLAVGADGALLALLPGSAVGPEVTEAVAGPEPTPGRWIVDLDAGGGVTVSLAGSNPDLVMVPAPGSLGRAAADDEVVAGLWAGFAHARRLGLSVTPVLVLPIVVAQAHAVDALLAAATGPARVELALLASRLAEYAGWMAQEAGDDRAAAWWTGRAVHRAVVAGDHDMAAYALVRRALITLYRDDGLATVDLARRAQADPATSRRVRGLAAQREAQGQALSGRPDDAARALDRADELLDPRDADHVHGAGGAPLGPSGSGGRRSLVAGWCLHDLGRSRAAAALLEGELAALPAAMTRPRARCAVRLALAHAADGELERSCQVAADALPLVEAVDSATVRTDVRRLSHTLARWRDHPTVRDLSGELAAALHRPAAW
jgi:hypothetical protein